MCSVSVKYLREHLKNAHKITEQEYMQLFSEDGDGPVTAGDLKNEWEEPESKRRAEDFEGEKMEQEVARLQQVHICPPKKCHNSYNLLQVYGVQRLQEPKKEVLEEEEPAASQEQVLL